MAKKIREGVTVTPVMPDVMEGSGNQSRPRTKVGPGSPSSGVIDHPSYASDPSVSKKPGNLSFTEAIDSGYSPNRFGGVNVVVPNGDTASSRGQGSTLNHQWADDGISGESNQTGKHWPGGNRTGE